MCAQTNVQDLCSCSNEIKLILFSSYDIEIQMCIVGTENANNQFCPEFQAQGHALQFGTFVQISAQMKSTKPYSHYKKTDREQK